MAKKEIETLLTIFWNEKSIFGIIKGKKTNSNTKFDTFNPPTSQIVTNHPNSRLVTAFSASRNFHSNISQFVRIFRTPKMSQT